MKAELPEPVNRALLLLNQAGFEAHVVGGCVRDLLMNKTPKDYDLTTSAHPEAIQRVFQGFPMTLDGLKHGTCLLYTSSHLPQSGRSASYFGSSRICLIMSSAAIRLSSSLSESSRCTERFSAASGLSLIHI